MKSRRSCALWTGHLKSVWKHLGLCSIWTFCPLDVSVVTVYLQNGLISLNLARTWQWWNAECVCLCVCACANPVGPNEGSPLALRCRPELFLVEMLHKCFSQFREIALPSSGPEDWMASKSDCNWGNVGSPFNFAALRKTHWTRSLSLFCAKVLDVPAGMLVFLLLFWLNIYFMIQFVASEFSVTAVFSRPAVQSTGKNAWKWETIAD